MKAHAFSSTLPVLLAFSLQASAEMAEVNLSEWDESAISAAKDKNSRAICLNIDAEDLSYREFTACLSRLYCDGFYDITVNYKGKSLNISSNGIENGLTVALPRSSEESTADEPAAYPFSEDISTESGPCTLVYHEITSSDPQAARKDMEQFRQYVLSLNRKEIGLLLFVEGDVSVHTVFEYILSIRDKVTSKVFCSENHVKSYRKTLNQQKTDERPARMFRDSRRAEPLSLKLPPARRAAENLKDHSDP